MLIYIISLAFILVSYPLADRAQVRNKRQLYTIMVGGWLFLVLALRGEAIGTDLISYLPWYAMFGQTPWAQIPSVSTETECEIGYVILNKLLFFFNDSSRMIIVAVALITVFIAAYSIYKNSKIMWLSFWIYITLGTYLKSFSALRQAVAMALVLLSYEALRKENFKNFFLFVLLASLFHKTALCFLPFYFFRRVKIEKIYIAVIAIVDLLLLVFGRKLITTLAVAAHYESYIKWIGQGNGMGILLIHIMILFFLLVVIKGKDLPEMNIYINAVLIAMLFNVLALHMAVIDRIMAYYDMILIYSLPNAVCMIKGIQMKRIAYLAIMSGTLMYYICIICRADNASIIPYQFYF